MKFLARAVLAVLLLLGVYVLAVGVVVLLTVALWQASVRGASTALLVKLGLVALGIALPVLGAFWKVLRTRNEPPPGLALPEADHPLLWEEVRSLAGAVGTRPPDEIRLLPEVNASVWARSRMLGLVEGRRVMTLGTPLVLGLSLQQVRSVLAHELGHYSHRHTALAPAVYRGQVTLGHLVDALGEDTWTGKLFTAYGGLYLRASTAVARRQELEADRWSARIAGRDAAARAMRELPALDGLWQFFLENYAFAVEGARPDSLHAGFGRVLADPVRQQERAAFGQELPEEPSSPYDTHPSTLSRVATFEALPEDGIVDDGTPARTLLGDLDATWRRLEAELFADSDLEPRPWEWLAHESGRQRSLHNAAMLVRASREQGSGAATLRDAVVGLSLGRTRSLVRPYVEIDTPPEAVDAAAKRMVDDLVALALVEHCGARFGVEWDGSRAVVDSTGNPVDVSGLLDATATEGAAWLLAALEDEGVPASYSVDPAQTDEAADQEPVVQAIAACAVWRRVRVVVVAENALVLKRIGWRDTARWGRHGGRNNYEKALRLVASTPLAQLLVDPNAEVHTWNRVRGARLTRRRLVLELETGVHRLRVRRRTVLGDLPGALRDHLGVHAVGT